MIEIETIDESMLQVNNETLLGWIVWCSTGDTINIFNSKEHSWEIDVPRIGIQYMYRIYDNYMEMVGGADYYCPYQLMDVEDIRPWIKFGLMIDQQVLSDIFNQVKDFTINDFNEL